MRVQILSLIAFFFVRKSLPFYRTPLVHRDRHNLDKLVDFFLMVLLTGFKMWHLQITNDFRMFPNQNRIWEFFMFSSVTLFILIPNILRVALWWDESNYAGSAWLPDHVSPFHSAKFLVIARQYLIFESSWAFGESHMKLKASMYVLPFLMRILMSVESSNKKAITVRR